MTDKDVQLDVINNKGKIDKVEKADFQGIGLQNARRRLELLYPRRYDLSVINKDNLFEVKLKVEL